MPLPLKRKTETMHQYQNLLVDILDRGVLKENRTATDTISIFGHQMRFDLSKGFPLVTTKYVHMKFIIHELLWMMSGKSSTQYLRDNGVTIWNEWDTNDYRPELGHPEFDIGPGYGVQFRSWPTFVETPDTYAACDVPGVAQHLPMSGERPNVWAPGPPIDQITEAIDKLKNKPNDRRNIVSAWNVADVPKMKLPACHCFMQFDVTDGKVSCQVYLRSWDVFLGGPFNIAQYALLTHMMAHLAGLEVGDLIVSSGDTHLYVNHLEQAKLQLSREPHPLPQLRINRTVTGIDDFRYEDFTIENYEHHPAIKAKVAV